MRTFVASLTFTAVTAASLLALSGTATAQDVDLPPAGDDRAVYFEGNIKPADCPTLWPGSEAIFGEEEPAENTMSIDINEEDLAELEEGIEIVGVVIKGGDGYNKYSAEKLGELPWLKLHSPYNNGGQIAAISHWFACGVVDDTTTTTTTTTTAATTTTTAGGTTTTTAGETTTTTVGNTTTTTKAAVAPVSNDSDLPDTGANVGWMIFLGAALLLSGGLLMGVPRIRNAVLRRN